MFSFDKLRSKAKARRSQRPATPPSPGSFFTSPRSPRWATRTNSDGSQYAIPPVPSLPPPLPDVMPIMAPPMPPQPPPPPPEPRPSTSSSSVDQQDNLRLDLGFHPGTSSSSLADWFPGGMGPVSTTPPQVHGHRKTPSTSQRSMQAASDALSPNSLFSPSSTVISSPNTTVAGSYSNGSVLGKEPRGFTALVLNSSDPILPYHGSEPKKESPSRRVAPVPAPIRIPDGTFHHPAVQVDRSQSPAFAATAVPEKPVAGPPPSPPPSPGTAHDAILASAFVLSGERTAESSWTLGATGLARMDSTTLPRDSYAPGQSTSKLRGPRPIRTNSRRQSSAPANLRRSSSATAVLPSTPPPAGMVPPPTPPSNGSGSMPTVVVSGPDMKRKRISAITEISSAGSVYSFPDEDAAVLRPDTTSTSKETLPSLTTGTSSDSHTSETEEEDREQERTLRPDERPALEQMWEFLLPDGSRIGTPRSGSTSTPSPFPESRNSPRSAPGSGARSTAPTSASPGPSPRTKSQKPTMLKLQEVPKRTSTKRKSVELVQDSTPDSPDFQEAIIPKGKGKQPAPSVPHTAAIMEDVLSPSPSVTQHITGQPRPPSGSTVNTVTGAASSSNGHSSTGSSAPGVLYLSFKKDGAGSVTGNMSSAMFPETPRSFEHSMSPAMGQTFTVEVTPANPKARTRAPTLPIGPRTGLSHIRTDGGLSSLSRDSSRGGGGHRQRATSSRTPLPPSPKFSSAPVRWKGLTYDAARWTLSSEQLQDIVTRAIKHSAESSSIRLLQPEVLDTELPAEIDALTKQREELRVRLKAQIRTRRLLMRKLNAGNSPDSLTPQGMARTTSEIMDACALCDQLSEELFHVSDQLAQLARLRDVHQASALSMALRKINTSFVRVTSEAVELQKRISTLEAEREEAWHTAESVERELNDVRAKLAQQTASCACAVGAEDSGHVSDAEGSRPSSRVAAARKTSMRASKASLRLSARKSRASSISSRYTLFSPEAGDDVPPVPPMPTTTSPLAALTDFSNQLSRERQSLGAASFMSSMISPTPEARALASAQAELLELLGINLSDITGNRSSNGSSNGPRRRPRSASFAAPQPSPGFLDAATSMSPQPSPRWTVGTGSPMVDQFGRRLRRSLSDYSKRVTAPRPDSMLLSPPRDGSLQAHQSRALLEDPDAILAMMTRANSSSEPSPMPGRTFPRAGRTYI